MAALVESPKKVKLQNDNYFFETEKTPPANLTDSSISLPPLKLSHKTNFQYPAKHRGSVLESPSKPSKITRTNSDHLDVFPLVVDTDTTEEDSMSDSGSCTSGLVSPVSDISSVPSSSPELSNKNGHLPSYFIESLPIPAFHYNMAPLPLLKESAQDEASDFDFLIQQSLHKRTLANSIPSDALLSPTDNTHMKRHISDISHRSRKRYCHPKIGLNPGKPILKLSPDSNRLNFIVASTTGSVKDATIFATEINSCNAESIPLPNHTWEKVTIPVNSHVKDKYKQERGKLISGYYDDSEDERTTSNLDKNSDLPQESSEVDAAVIRAYEFEGTTSSSKFHWISKEKLGFYSEEEYLGKQRNGLGKLFRSKKKMLRWADMLEW